MTENMNETLLKMVTNLKPSSMDVELNGFEYDTSLKRPLSPNNLTESSQSSFDVLPTPVKKLKRESKYDLTYIGSPREMRRLRADLLEARNTILSLEDKIQQMHNIRKEMELFFESERNDLTRQRERDRKSIEELETLLQSIRKREMELKEELSEVKNNYNILKISKDKEIEELDKTLSEIKQETRFYDSEESTEVSNLNRKLTDVMMLLEAAEEDAQAQKQLVNELQRQLAEKNSVERDLEMKELALQNAKLKIKELEYEKENVLEFREQAKTQAYKLANYVELERDNQRLREENTRIKDEIRNKLLLEEEVHDLKSRLKNYKEQEKKFGSLQMQQVQTEMHLNEWRSVARGICETTGSDVSLPHLLRSVVERLQQQEIHLTSTKVELESQLTTALHEAKVAKSELDKNQKLLADLKRTGEQKQTLIHRMQKKLLLISRERDSYRSQLDSYEKDLTMNVTNPSQSQKERIDSLERVIDSYKDMVAKLESDLQNSQPYLYQEMAPARAEQVARLQEEIEQLKLENDKLRQRKDQLEIQLEDYLVGNDTLQGGRVYHMGNNPLNECLVERERNVEKLEQEVERLKRKVKNLEQGLEASKLNESICPKEVQKLKSEIKTMEAETRRMKDYFKSAMQDIRDVTYMLFGYKMDVTCNSLYKLTSMYADRPEDQLCFQYSNNGTMNLLENEFSATLENMVALHLRHQKSIPVFLSAITLDLFNNKTVTTKSFEID